ncbi:prominin-1-like [Penaeus japonicus]|uniref:prominin-1-like n=1 Tax=Penaeus japonicus TaxID=27405 RepID=UPI001C7110F5|nr:prominin-1-like [Penaeus japonicus]
MLASIVSIINIACSHGQFSFSEQLRLLSAVESHNLTETARHARYEFENIPNYIESMTRRTRDDVKRAVRTFRAHVYSRVRGLDDVAFDLEVRTRDITWRVDEAAALLQKHEAFRWYTGLAISVSLGFVWTLLVVGLCCGCCSHASDQAPTERSCVSNSAGQTLLTSVFFMFLLSSVLWAVVVALFVVGAHAHAFICHPLYEEPTFATLASLVDRSGMVFQDGPMLSNVLHPGRDVHLGVGEVLSQCKEGGAAYQVFKLRHYFDIENEIDHSTTFDLRDSLSLLKVNLSKVELLSTEAEANLDKFLRSVKIDLAPYRKEMDKPLVRKNLPALAEQMQNVAGQLRSVAASAELFKMVARTRNIISNTLYPLEKRKEDVTYQVATLDLEVMPLQRQINQSSGHLRTIQYFIHSHGSSLAAAKARGYVERILSYTRQYTEHVRNAALLHVAPCTPVWNLFDSARGVTCNGIIEPLNALWLATCWCLLLFLPAIVMSLGLARFYLRMDHDDDTLPLHSNGSPPGSSTNLQSGSSSALWGPKATPHTHSHHGYPSRHHNGTSKYQYQAWATRLCGHTPPPPHLPGTTRKDDLLASRPERDERAEREQPEVRREASSRFRRQPRASQRLGPEEVVAGAQVAAWRDAWRAGAGFVTLELVARHVHRPIDWVHQHWHDDPRVLASSLDASRVEHCYSEPAPASHASRPARTCQPQPYIVCWGCCDAPASS